MKILAIGRNYSGHIKELRNESLVDPVVFLKPDTALLRKNATFYYPDFSTDIQYEVELILRIGKEGKHIAEKFAEKYIDGVGVGIDFTARDVQKRLKDKGLPWTLAKGFNGAAPVSDFKSPEEFEDLSDIVFSLKKNNELKQKGNSGEMIFAFERIISFISGFITLKKGDIIFTGTPEGVGRVAIGDKLECFIGDEKMLEVDVK